jgi:hypothetical protein
MFRCVPYFEKKQRGCQYCKDMEVKNFQGVTRNACPFFECPYTVLNKYKTYEEFMASEDSKIMVNEFFASVATVYELSSRPCKTKVLFSDGDGRIGL